MTEDKNKNLLVVSVTYPLILFFVLMLLSHSFTFLLLSSTLFILAFNFIMFRYPSNTEKWNGGLRMLISLLVLVVNGLAFKELTFFGDRIPISGIKVGWLLGVVVIVLINYQYLLGQSRHEQSWMFTNDEGSVLGSKFIIKRYIIIALVMFTELCQD